MKPVCKLCGNTRPGICNQTLFGLNMEVRNDAVIIHGNLSSKKKVT